MRSDLVLPLSFLVLRKRYLSPPLGPMCGDQRVEANDEGPFWRRCDWRHGALAPLSSSFTVFCVLEVRLSIPLQLLRFLECEVRCVASIAEVLDERVEAARGTHRHPIVALLVPPRARGAGVVRRDPRRVLHPSAANGARHRGSARFCSRKVVRARVLKEGRRTRNA